LVVVVVVADVEAVDEDIVDVRAATLFAFCYCTVRLRAASEKASIDAVTSYGTVAISGEAVEQRR